MELKVFATEVVADDMGNIAAVQEEYMNYQKSRNHRTVKNSTSARVLLGVLNLKAALLLCNSQYLGTGRGTPVRKGKQ